MPAGNPLAYLTPGMGVDPDAALRQVSGNPFVNLLARYFAGTPDPVRFGPPKATPAPATNGAPGARMAATKGPIQANKPKQIAAKRKAIMDRIP